MYEIQLTLISNYCLSQSKLFGLVLLYKFLTFQLLLSQKILSSLTENYGPLEFEMRVQCKLCIYKNDPDESILNITMF